MPNRHSKKHNCALDLELDKPPQSRILAFCRNIQKTFQISHAHPSTYKHFRSYPTLVAERHRQLTEGCCCIIHPLSSFSLYWNSFMVLVNVSHMIVSTFRLCFLLYPKGTLPSLHAIDYLLLALNVVCFLDIIVKLHTGFFEGHSNVVLKKLRCMCHYLQRYFFIDLITCLPLTFFLLYFEVQDRRYVLMGHLLAIMRLLSIYRDSKNFVIFIKRFHVSYLVYSSLRNVMLFLLSAHWLTCLKFGHCAIYYYWFGDYPENYSHFILAHSKTIPFMSIGYRYKKAAFTTYAAFFGTCFANHIMRNPVEILCNVCTIIYTSLVMIYALVYAIKAYFTKENSVIRYYELMNQLKEYMRHKQFPASLKKRVIAFYNYKFQGTYFREDTVLAGLSDQLRDEIALHSCHKLVNKVALFDGLPADVVGSVLGCLRSEVYLPNDLVVRAGDIGDCMYFIAYGTVAVFSLKGVEVCHLEDGAYFGEVALLMKDSKRVATVVAVEITQVYRLDAEHFRYFIESYEELHERIEALASQRMHETVVLDEAFKHDRERGQFSGHELSQPDLSMNSPNAAFSNTNFSSTTIEQSPRNPGKTK